MLGPVAAQPRGCHTGPVTRLTIIGLAVLVVSLVVGSVGGGYAVSHEDELGGAVIGLVALMGILSGGMLMHNSTRG